MLSSCLRRIPPTHAAFGPAKEMISSAGGLRRGSRTTLEKHTIFPRILGWHEFGRGLSRVSISTRSEVSHHTDDAAKKGILAAGRSTGQVRPSNTVGVAYKEGPRRSGEQIASLVEKNEERVSAGENAGRDCFFPERAVLWTELGISEKVLEALKMAQLEQPSVVQAAAVPLILGDADVVVAAETGSGKTHAYLAPICDKLLRVQQASPVAENASTPQARRPGGFALVLCPNSALCLQVAKMASGLCIEPGRPLLQVSVICGGQGWPVTPPDMVVATPAALLNNLFAYDPKRRRRSAFIRDVQFVVFDEADMLLSGGFANQVTRLVDMFRFEEKQKSKATQSDKEGPSVEAQQPWTDFQIQDGDEAEEEADEQIFEQDDEDWDDDGLDQKDLGPEVNALQNGKARSRREDWLRSRKRYQRSKQYVFVAATLPENGKKTPGAVLRQKFPDASWVSGNFLHRHNPRLERRWIQVDPRSRIESLLEAIALSGQFKIGDEHSRTMVFANSVDTVDAIAGILQRAGVQCLCYHRDIVPEEKTRTLKTFQETGGVLVCTDAAARGLDISNVGHIIQAEFALSVVDYLHRIGRTARAGNPGVVTSFYTEANKPLVDAVRSAEAQSQAVESAFSRKRSFRKRLRKYG